MKSKDFGHSKVYLFLNFSILAGYVVLYPIITNYLNPTLYGEYIILHAILSIFVSILDLGCKIGYRRNFFESNDIIFRNNLLFSCQVFISIIFIIIFLFFLNFGNKILNYFNVSNELISISSLLLASLILDNFCKYFLINLENNKDSKKYSKIFFIKTYFFFFISISYLILGHGIKSLVYGLFISNVILLLISLYIQFSKKNLSYNFDIKLIKNVLLISIPSIPTSFFSKINSDLDKLLIGYFLNSESAGIYSIGQSIAYSIFQIMTSLDKVYIPSLYKMMFNNRIKLAGSYLISFFFFFGFLTLGLILSANIIVDVFLDSTYRNSKFIIMIFSIYYLSLFFSKIVSHQFIFLKKVIVNTYFFFISMSLNFLFTIPAVIYFNIYGAAIATTVSSLISLIISIIIVKRHMNISFNSRIVLFIYFFIIFGLGLEILIIFSEFESNYYLQILVLIIVLTFYIFYGFGSKIIKKNFLNNLYNLKKNKT